MNKKALRRIRIREEEKKILAKARKEKLPIVDKDFNLKGLITIKDIEKQIKYPQSAKDEQGRRLCAVAIGVSGDVLDVDAFKAWRPEYNNAEFILEDGKYVCGWAVEKMSKSMYNVVNPDMIVEKYGADTLRLYEMFLDNIIWG